MTRQIWIIFLLLWMSSTWAKVAVVGNQKNQKQLRENDVKKIFLGQSRSFPDGTPALAFDQARGSSIREEFHTKVLSMTEAQYLTYWSEIVFTGKGRPPATMGDDEAVKRSVAADPNAIGYIDSKSVDKSVSVLFYAD